VDAVTKYQIENPNNFNDFIQSNQLEDKPMIALLAGSRRQEIKDNLPKMLEAASLFPDYQLVLAGAPGIEPDFYNQYIGKNQIKILFGQTYRILQHSKAALVTSGTATLETALFQVPQVVCYYIAMGKIISFLRRKFLKVPYISLVNLIAGKEVVKELVADSMTVENIQNELKALLYDTPERKKMMDDYKQVIHILGPAGASQKAAKEMVKLLAK